MQKILCQFSHSSFKTIRTIVNGNQYWLVLEDIQANLENKGNSFEQTTINVKENDIMKQFEVIDEYGLFCLLTRCENEELLRWIFYEVLPQTRLNCFYLSPKTIDQIYENPDILIKIANKAYKEKLKTSKTKQEIQDLFCDIPEIDYLQLVENGPEEIKLSEIAIDYGIKPQVLNQYLAEWGIQNKIAGTWRISPEFDNQGYVIKKFFMRPDNLGNMQKIEYMLWTKKGRLFLFKLLGSKEIYPVCN